MIDKDIDLDKAPLDLDGDRGGEEGDSRRSSSKRYTVLSDRNRCRFTRAGVDRIDYKDVVTLQKLMTSQGKIFSRKRSGNAARYQRMVKIAIKRARFMALLPYTG
jgi:small subunit ribosomal protein S18